MSSPESGRNTLFHGAPPLSVYIFARPSNVALLGRVSMILLEEHSQSA